MPSASKLEKAYLALIEPTSFGVGPLVGMVRLNFNPKEYSVDRSSNWSTKPEKGSKAASTPEFLSPQPRSMKLEVFLDATEDREPTALARDVKLLFSCTAPHPKTIVMGAPSPPFVIFGWGRTMSFLAYVKQVGVKYTMFRPDGVPVRATANLSLEEVPRTLPWQNPTSGGVGTLRTHTVVDGDTLQSLAYREYGSADAWRAIARANNIDDPRRVPSGTRLLMPAAEAAAGSV